MEVSCLNYCCRFLFCYPLKALWPSGIFSNLRLVIIRGHHQTNKVTGIGADFKLGVNWGSVGIGLDYGYAPSLTTSAGSYDLSMTNTGLALIFRMQSWRLWYVHLSSADLGWKDAAGTETALTGGGSKFGMGAKLSNSLSFNLVFNFLKYDEQTVAGTTSSTDQFMDLAYISISWPKLSTIFFIQYL